MKGTRRLMRVSACSQTATSMPGSVSERDSSVDESLSMQPNGYFHATYSAGSVSERDSLVLCWKGLVGSTERSIEVC